MFTSRRSTSRIDVGNYNTLLYPAYDTNINLPKNYCFSQSPPPMTYRDLRSVISNKNPSDLIIFSKSSNSSLQNYQKNIYRKKFKRQGIDVYRSLLRAQSRCSTSYERDIQNNERMISTNPSIVDHRSPSPINGYFYPQNLPNTQKYRTNNNNTRIGSAHTKLSYSSSPSLRIQHVGHVRSTPSQFIHRTTPVETQSEESDSEITIPPPMTPSPTPELQTRKQLHVYMPQILSC